MCENPRRKVLNARLQETLKGSQVDFILKTKQNEQKQVKIMENWKSACPWTASEVSLPHSALRIIRWLCLGKAIWQNVQKALNSLIFIPEMYCMEMTGNMHKNLAARVAPAVQLEQHVQQRHRPRRGAGPSGCTCELESYASFQRQVGEH